jgi:hypothetical protein
VSRRLLRWAALPVVDRRWAASLSAVALGFGLFIGVAIGPGAAGTFATGAGRIIAIAGSGDGATDVETKTETRPRAASIARKHGRAEGFSDPTAASTSSPFVPPPVAEPEDAEPTEPADASLPEDESRSGSEAPESEKEVLSGVVVHVNEVAGSYAVATADGGIRAVHAPTAPKPGTRVKVPVRQLQNGTVGQVGTRIRLGRQTRAAISGVVTYVDPTPAASAYTVSKRGVSVLVHVHPEPAGPTPALPALGALANVAVDIEKPETVASVPAPIPAGEPVPPPSCALDPNQPPPTPHKPMATLWQRSLDTEEVPLAYGDFAGIVTAICLESDELLVSADDVRESADDLLFDISSAEVDAARLRIGDSVLATGTIDAGGNLALTGLADDDRTRGADDFESLQGDLAAGGP